MKTEKELPKSREELLALIYRSLSNGIRAAKSKKPREWLTTKGLSIDTTGACFNSGQIHHRKSLEYKSALADVGFMQRTNVGVNSDTIPYTVFGIFSIMFPLRNEKNEIVNFFSIRIRSENTAYMNQEPGLYPGYPSEFTKKLFVVNTVIDAATLLESKILDNREAVIALHDGKVMAEHEKAIKGLTKLEQIIYIDGSIEKIKKEDKVWDRIKNGK